MHGIAGGGGGLFKFSRKSVRVCVCKQSWWDAMCNWQWYGWGDRLSSALRILRSVLCSRTPPRPCRLWGDVGHHHATMTLSCVACAACGVADMWGHATVCRQSEHTFGMRAGLVGRGRGDQPGDGGLCRLDGMRRAEMYGGMRSCMRGCLGGLGRHAVC